MNIKLVGKLSFGSELTYLTRGDTELAKLKKKHENLCCQNDDSR